MMQNKFVFRQLSRYIWTHRIEIILQNIRSDDFDNKMIEQNLIFH